MDDAIPGEMPRPSDGGSSDGPRSPPHAPTPRRLAQRQALRLSASLRNGYVAEIPARKPPEPDSDSDGEMEASGPMAWLHVYDLHGTQGTNSTLQPVGLGIYHAGIELFGVEWAFGYVGVQEGQHPVTGIYPVEPRSCPAGIYRDSVCLGPVTMQAEDVWLLLRSIAADWLGTAYHPLKRNCLHFCTDLSGHLKLSDLPGWVARLATAADMVLSPVLDALNMNRFNIPCPAAPAEDKRPEETLPAAEGSVPCTQSKLQNFQRVEESPLSMETLVAWEFHQQFIWARHQMRIVEEKFQSEIAEELLAKRPKTVAAFL